MKRIRFLLLVFVQTAFGQTGSMPDHRTLTYLKKFRGDYVQSMLNGKNEVMESYYAENIRLMPEFQKTVMGKNNTLLYHKAFSGRFDLREYDMQEIEIIDLGSRVVELGIFNMKIILKSTNKTYDLKGKYQNFWEKKESGQLALLTRAWNYSHQVDIGDQLKFAEVPAVNIALESHLPVNDNISFELAALNRLSEMIIMQHDDKLWSRFFADDARFIYSNSPIYSGRKELDDFLKEHVKHLPVFEKLDIRNDHIDHLGDYVIEYASHIAIIRDGEFSGVFTGKNITIWRREKDCSLKIFRGMAMYD